MQFNQSGKNFGLSALIEKLLQSITLRMHLLVQTDDALQGRLSARMQPCDTIQPLAEAA